MPTKSQSKPLSAEEYRKRWIELLSEEITTYPCQDCFSPVLSMRCCSFCGSTDPSGDTDEHDLSDEEPI